MTRPLLVPYAYASIASIACIPLSSFELKAILLVFPLRTLCLSHLNLCCVFNFNLVFFMNSLGSFLRQSTLNLFFSRYFV